MRFLSCLPIPFLAALAFGCAENVDAPPVNETLASDSLALSEVSPQVAAATAPAARYPIVLLQGLGGLDNFTPGRTPDAYWPNVIPALAAVGEAQVYALSVSPFNSSDVRAVEIEEQILKVLQSTGASKVNIIAHSQGGLDARVLASPGGRNFGAKIASVTTIATPHQGTRVADLALAVVAGGFIEASVNGLLALLQRSAGDLQSDPQLRSALRQLSTSYMVDEFNPKTPDAPGVRYESYAGRSNFQPAFGVCDGGALRNQWWELDAAGSILLPTAIFLELGIPLVPNDGLVTVESAKWGKFVQCVPADHSDEVGRGDSKRFDHLAFYKRVVARIRKNGF
jgi:triacylglycerol lipase